MRVFCFFQALDKLDRPIQLDPRAIEASLCSNLSDEEREHCVRGEVDVSIRTAFIEFLFSPEILGNIDCYLCIFRLFPRPVVSLRSSAFMSNYQKSSPSADTQFIRNLIRSQVRITLCFLYVRVKVYSILQLLYLRLPYYITGEYLQTLHVTYSPLRRHTLVTP